MSKSIYRVYDTYCTGDSTLHSESKELADSFCAALNKKSGSGAYYQVEEILMEVPYWIEDQDCMPGTQSKESNTEQVIGVWNPVTKEIAVDSASGIKVVDFAHWHCHCTMEVIVRENPNHPLVKARIEEGDK